MGETSTWWVTLALAVDIAFRVIALVIVPRNRRPQTAMAWLLAIFFIPYFGFLAFVAFGSRRLPKKRRENQRAINAHLRARSTMLARDMENAYRLEKSLSEQPALRRVLARVSRLMAPPL